MEKHITINDIARMANVSRSTVSRILNGNVNVSEKKRNLIMQVIHDNNFIPNDLARNLVKGTNNTLGVFVGDIANQYYSEVLKGIEKAVSNNNYIPITCFINGSEKEEYYIEEMIKRRCSGIIIVSTSIHNIKLVERLSNFSKIVSIQSDVPSLCEINSSDEYGSYQITNHLIQLGHKKIAYVQVNNNHSVLINRRKGFEKACSDAGIAIPSNYIIYTDNEALLCQSVQELMHCNTPPTAICCCNDYIACIINQKLKAMQIQIPEDVSLTGYDNLPISSIMEPKLTTISQPIREMGKTAVETLIKLIQSPNTTRFLSITFPIEIVIRDSVAPPK